MPDMTLERRSRHAALKEVVVPENTRQSQMRREKFLKRIVDHIEEGRLHRTYSLKNGAGHETRKSISSETHRSKNGKENGSNGESISPRKRGSPLLSTQTFHTTIVPSLYGKGSGKNSYWVGSPYGTHSLRKPPRIRIKSPSLDGLNINPDLHLLRSPLSPGSSLQSPAPGGFKPRPPSPMFPRRDPEPGNLFSWTICTPTNWKRGKTEREILLERKMLRRKGKQSSQSKFISVFKLKESGKLTAADRIRRVLKRAQYYGDDIKRLPLVRFRRAVRTLIALLKTVKLSRDKGKGLEPTTWIDEDDIRGSKRAYGMFGVTFDVFSFRARREIQVSNEAKAILSMAPGTRSDEQQHVALVSLSQAVPEFGEFPIAMQEALVRVGWYETFEARRIIIREGHMADNFYLILSGSAVVTIREQNGAGEYFGRTVAVLQRGNSFGELALIYGGKRSATVTCKDNVELLAVGRDDYIDIFMHKTKDGGEPEHIKFLKQIKVFCGWPIHSLPLDDPSIFLYTYVRRGMVLCKDSNQSDWIYVIKSGSCRVLTALHKAKPSIPSTDRTDHSTEGSLAVSRVREERHHSPLPTPRLCPLRAREGQSRGGTSSHDLPRSLKLPSITNRSDLEVQESAVKHQQELDEILRKRNIIQPMLVTEVSHHTNEDSPRGHPDQSNHKSKSDRIFVNLITLQSKDVYGLESVVLSVFKEPTRTSLVSDGAECIMISKKFFQQKLSEDVAKKIRREIRPMPSEEVLQEKLQTKKDWDTYRSLTVADFVQFRKQLHSLQVL